MREFLKGKKTYIIAGLGLANVAFHYFVVGDITQMQALNDAFTFLGIGTVRAGIAGLAS